MEDSGRKIVNIAVELVRKHVSIASRHPLLVCVVFVMIWLNRSFPVLFSLLICASPVIASTFVLLGTLLFYGHANAPEIQNQIHSIQIRALGNTETGEGSYLVNNMNMSDNHKFGSWIQNCQKLKQEAKGQYESSETGNNKLKSSDGSRRYMVDEDNKGWETGSDLGESSSPSASMADINSMLDELHPLSGSEVPFPHVSTDAASDHSLESGEFVNEADDYDDDREDMDVKDDGEESAVTWTTDDQRNLMNLGTSELERNQFLENLVARKKALRNLRILAEKNMVNISPDLHFNSTHISTARKNHFDLPYHIHENNLGFAHSVMIPRSNPFDLHPDPSGPKSDQVGPTFQSVPFQTNEPLGPRRESFDFDSSSLGPYSIPEQIPSDPKSTGSHHTSDISEYIIQRSQFSEDNGTVKPHQVAQGDDRINEVDISGENTGYEEKTSSKSSSSSFFDVTDDIYDGDDDNEEEEYRSVDSPMAQDSKELQIEDSIVGYSATGNTEGGLPQRLSQVQHGLKSWLTGWKA